MTPESAEALAQLRHVGHFEWQAVNVLAFVVYAYASAVRRSEWTKVALGIGFFAVELVWEMFNGLVLHFSDHAALWTVAGKSTFVIYVGLNLEIAMMFAVAPLVLLNLLPDDRGFTIAGVPNRVLIPVVFGLFCVAVESVLNRWGVLVWTWPFWRWPHLWLVAVAYCGPMLLLVRIYDRVSLRRQVQGAAAAVALAALCHLVLASGLGWV
jgi:hypothetical protein